MSLLTGLKNIIEYMLRETEFDIKKFFLSLTDHWKDILSAILIFGVGGAIYSLSLPDIYKSDGLYKLNNSNMNTGGMSGLAGFASFAGINLNNTSSIDYVIEVIESYSFFEMINSKHDLKPSLMASDYYDKGKNRLIFDDSLYNSTTNMWADGISVPSDQDAYEEYIANLNANVSLRGGFLELSFEHVSPVFAKEMIAIIVSDLNTVEREKDRDRYEKSIDYLINQISQSQFTEVRSTLGEVLQGYYEKLLLLNTEPNYLITPIDNPLVPERKHRPSRTLIVLLLCLMGGLLVSTRIIYIQLSNYNKE